MLCTILVSDLALIPSSFFLASFSQILYHVMLHLIARGDRASVQRASSLIALLRIVPPTVWADAHSPESSIYVPLFAQALSGGSALAALGSGHSAGGIGVGVGVGSIVLNASLDCGPILSVFGSLWGHSRAIDSTLCSLFDSLWPSLTSASLQHAYALLCAEVSRVAVERSVLDAAARAAHPNLFGSAIGSSSSESGVESDARVGDAMSD